MNRRLRLLTITIPGTAVMAVSTGAFAATSGSPTVQLEEVVVTARKVEESSQSVPVSIVAFSGADLQKKAIASIQDVHVPGLYITSDTQGGQATFAIRGAKQGNGTSDTVTAYVGDMPVVSNYAISHMMYDMQSISVLKGPQGTLFGANSTGGAIIFTPNAPGEKFEGYADVGVGNYNLKSFQGMINVPVNDVLQFRIAGEVVDRSKGYVKNHPPAERSEATNPPAIVFPNTATDLDTDKHQSARLGIRIRPTDGWDNHLTFEYFHENDQPHPEILAAQLGPFIFGGSLPINYQLYGGQIVGDRNNVMFGGPASGTHRQAKIWDAIWTTTVEFGDQASFKNVVAYQDDKLNFSTDNDASAWNIVNGSTDQRIKNWSWEPSIDWKADDGHFRNKTGLFYSHKDWEWFNSYGLLGLPFDFSGLPVAFQQGAYDATYAALPTSGHQIYNRKFKSYAVYTQFSYDLSSELTATLGLRYSWDRGDYNSIDKKSVGLATAGSQGTYVSTDPNDVCTYGSPAYSIVDTTACTAAEKYRSSAPSYTLTLEDRFNDTSLVYAKLSGGYLLGGFNNQVSTASAPYGLNSTFKPEKVTEFEAGLKSDWSLADRPVRTNLAIFYGNYKDQQRFQNANINGANIIGTVNAGASTFYGLDLDVTYAPFDSLELSASWNHLETEYTKFDSFISGAITYQGITPVPASIDLSGTELAQAPKNVLNGSATYTWPLPESVGTLSSTVNYYWTASTSSQDTPTKGCTAVVTGTTTCTAYDPILDFTAYDKIPSYGLLGFSTAWKSIFGSTFDINIWGKNLTDKYYWTSTSNQMLVFGYASRIYGEPRTFGANVRYNF